MESHCCSPPVVGIAIGGFAVVVRATNRAVWGAALRLEEREDLSPGQFGQVSQTEP